MYNLLDAILNGPARNAAGHYFCSPITLIFILAYALIWILFCILRYTPAFIAMLLRCSDIGSQTIEHSFLEITFPSDTNKTSFATEQLYIILRNQVSYPHLWDELAGHKRLHSFELVSAKNEGIRYVMGEPPIIDGKWVVFKQF